MNIKKKYFAWSSPFLKMVAEHLCSIDSEGKLCDLSGTTLVVPVSRAGRRLLELMVTCCEQNQQILIPPKIVTPGGLPQLFFESSKDQPTTSVRLLCWIRALSKADAHTLENILDTLPERFHQKLALARELEARYRELSAEGISFAQVSQAGQEVEHFHEQQRWEALQEICDLFLAELSKLDLEDVHQRRIQELESDLVFEGELILVGVAELSGIARQFLTKSEGNLQIFVNAPEEHAKGFDVCGAFAADYWELQTLPVSESDFIVVSDSRAQARACVSELAASASGLRPDQITIGVTEQSIVPFIKEELQACSLEVREAAGQAFTSSSVYQLIEAIQRYHQERSFEALGTLCRHPFALRFLAERLEVSGGQILRALDQYHSLYLQARVHESGRVPGSGKLQQILQGVVHEWNSRLEKFENTAQDISNWANSFVSLLGDILEKSESKSREFHEALKQLRQILVELREIPLDLQFECTPKDVFTLLMARLSSAIIAEAPGENVVEILGWLEIPMDDADRLFLLGCNEGLLPESVCSDPFLPDSLRTKLGLTDNRKRFARELFHLNALLHSPMQIKFFCSRVDQKGQVLMPSRLLLACDDQSLISRVQRVYGSQQQIFLPAAQHKSVAHNPYCAFPPEPLTVAPESMSVSGFKAYLACPYRYYLSHILKLESIDDSAVEMDAPHFGSVAHQILAAFGESSISQSQDPGEIFAKLIQLLRSDFSYFYSRDVMPAVRLQVEQLSARLQSFADWQAGWSSDGWCIHAVEYELPAETSALQLADDQQMLVRGRIDRIDRNQRTGEWAVIDYKTSEGTLEPGPSHYRKNSGWIDLQLPLYEHLLRQAGFDGDIRLGYVSIGSDVSRVEFQEAGWDQADLSSAIEKAREVANHVNRQQFWPPAKVAFDPFKELFGATGQEFSPELEVER